VTTSDTGGAGAGAPGARRVGVLADREFRGLWAAFGLSLAGDQLAQVALAVLVFQTTGSAAATAAVFAVSLVPWLIGGPLLSGLGDRYPRRTVMVGCDLASALLVAAMALPGLSLPVLCGLLFVVVLLHAPFAAARSALVRDIFPDDRYTAATAVSSLTRQIALVAGFAAGGLLVAVLDPREALLLDAASFIVSAAVVRLTVRARPAATVAAGGRRPVADLAAGARLVFGDRLLRTLTWYAWLAACHVGGEGVVVPLAAENGGGPVAVGLLLAADAAGTSAGMIGLTRWVPPDRRTRLIPPLAVLAAVPFLACATNPPLPVIWLLWLAAGAGTGYQLAANTAFVAAVPNERRAQAFGLVMTGLGLGQGAAIITAGLLAQATSPAFAVAGFGLVGTLAALTLAAGPGRTLTAQPRLGEQSTASQRNPG